MKKWEYITYTAYNFKYTNEKLIYMYMYVRMKRNVQLIYMQVVNKNWTETTVRFAWID